LVGWYVLFKGEKCPQARQKAKPLEKGKGAEGRPREPGRQEGNWGKITSLLKGCLVTPGKMGVEKGQKTVKRCQVIEQSQLRCTGKIHIGTKTEGNWKSCRKLLLSEVQRVQGEMGDSLNQALCEGGKKIGPRARRAC